MNFPLKVAGKTGNWYLTSSGLQNQHGIMVVFTSRHGGVSSPPYESLNLAFRVGDDPSRVLENRQQLCTRLGLDLDSWVLAEQVHGLEIATVTQKDRGKGAKREEGSIPSVDGLVTQETGLALILLFADCVPVVVLHPATRTAGIAHAGWKGTLGKIGENLVRKVAELSKAEPVQLLGFIGPAIGSCCYQVDAGRREAFRRNGEEEIDDSRLDLVGINVAQLMGSGIPRQSIEIAGRCTSCQNADFYSFRADGGVTGRQAGLVALW